MQLVRLFWGDILYIPQQCTGVALAQCSLKKCRRLVQVNTEWMWSVHSIEFWSSWAEKDSIKVDWKSFHKKPLKEPSSILVKEFRKLTSKPPTIWRKCLKKDAFLKTMLSYKVKTHIYFHQEKGKKVLPMPSKILSTSHICLYAHGMDIGPEKSRNVCT